MLLQSTHTTTYLYSNPVSVCHTQVHLAPRQHLRQRVREFRLLVSPEPASASERLDYFGNRVTSFSLEEQHQTLSVKARSVVELIEGRPIDAASTPPWELVRQAIRKYETPDALEACEFAFASPKVDLGDAFASYAARSFGASRPLLSCMLDLAHRIFTEFRYDPRATTVSTPVAEVLEARHGVCQDFAHFFIACLRSLGLPARYVSGYLRSGPNSIGAEASHAWVSVFCPHFGWIDIDPTNDCLPCLNHVTVAWGRDYSDVSPVKGVATGGGEQLINVAVEVVPA